jgi:hypothetical protein
MIKVSVSPVKVAKSTRRQGESAFISLMDGLHTFLLARARTSANSILPWAERAEEGDIGGVV